MSVTIMHGVIGFALGLVIGFLLASAGWLVIGSMPISERAETPVRPETDQTPGAEK